MKYLFLYILLLNALAFLLFAIDKRKAKKQRWRIREATLLWLAFVGGSLGALIGMKLFHHKTLHRRFTILVPFFLLFHIALLVVGFIYLS